MTKTTRTITRWTVGLLLVVAASAVAAQRLCACLPTEYDAVEVAEVPRGHMERFEALAPGVEPTRAWRYEKGPERGYLIRGGSGFFDRKDVRVADAIDADPSAPAVLEPVGDGREPAR